MNARFWGIIVSVLAVLMFPASAARAEPHEIRIVTQAFAPLQWNNEGTPDGYVAHYMREVVNRVGDRIPVSVRSFEFLPWKRAILTARTDPDVLLFSLSRTAEREHQFHWLGEVSPYGQYFFQLKSRPGIEVERIEDLRELNVKIGVQDGGNLHAYMKSLKFDESGHLIPITDYRQGIEMLYPGRIDLLPLTGFLARASFCKQGYDGGLLAPVVFIEALAKPLWAVFSKGTDPQLVEAFRKEMRNLQRDGFPDGLTGLHTRRWEARACGLAQAG